MKCDRKFIPREELKKQMKMDTTPRTTLSFYRYVILEKPEEVKEELLKHWGELGVLGRIYLAYEGINSQMSIPTENLQKFRELLDADARFARVPFKIAVEDDGRSFYKLCIKVRKKIVADGLDDNSFDVTNVGKHLNAEEFNQAMENPETIVVDMRNHYESEVGRFDGAICPEADTFREELPMVIEELKDKKDKKILMYCTGGVRCEKASAYLKHHGFKDVNQLYGGIIEYAKEIKQKGIESKFRGKNFVFDERLGERITEDILSKCHQCGTSCDNHTNCKNDDCHLLFIQCDACQEKFDGCCTNKCKEIWHLPVEEQRKIRRRNKDNQECLAVYKSRLRPKLNATI